VGPSWYHNCGATYFSQIVFEIVPNPATAVSELFTGDLDVVAPVDASQPGRVKGNRGVKLCKSIGPLRRAKG